jgi:hypothetical protein
VSRAPRCPRRLAPGLLHGKVACQITCLG